MISKQYTDEFKAEAVKQVTERGYPVAEVAKRLGVSSHSLYEWLRKAKNAAHAAAAIRCCNRRQRIRRKYGA